MANRKIIVALGVFFLIFHFTTMDSKAMEITDIPVTVSQSQSQNQNETNDIYPDESDITPCPDLELSYENLLLKYKNMGYDAIQQIYHNAGYSDDDFHTLMQKAPELKFKYTLTSDELDLLYKVTYAEAGNQDYDTITYIVSVIINRVNSSKFPDTLSEVVMQQSQFEVVLRGTYLTAQPDEKTINAVNDILMNGVNIDSDVLFFRNSHYHEEYTQAFNSGNMYFSSLS